MGDIGKTKRVIEIIPEPRPEEAPIHEPALPATTPAEQPVPA